MLRCRGVEARRSGGLEVCSRPSDFEEWRYGALEARCRRSDVEV